MVVSQEGRQAAQDYRPPDVLAPARVGPVRLRNRVIKAATYEGLSRRGKVTDSLIDFHVRHAAGGVGMTTVAYCAVAPEGRSDRHQVLWRSESASGLRKLTDAVHAEGAAVSAQLGHAGPVANPKANGSPALAPSRMLHKTTLSFTRAASHDDLRRIVTAHADAARMAVDTGFDAVEVHLGHSYLASAFLSPKFNRRTDGYGRGLESRAPLSLEIIQADATTRSPCIHCDKCMTQIYGGTRCVLAEHESQRGKSERRTPAETENRT